MFYNNYGNMSLLFYPLKAIRNNSEADAYYQVLLQKAMLRHYVERAAQGGAQKCIAWQRKSLQIKDI
jgi:hypothetical protein